jgi:hypothetical protein
MWIPLSLSFLVSFFLLESKLSLSRTSRSDEKLSLSLSLSNIYIHAYTTPPSLLIIVARLSNQKRKEKKKKPLLASMLCSLPCPRLFLTIKSSGRSPSKQRNRRRKRREIERRKKERKKKKKKKRKKKKEKREKRKEKKMARTRRGMHNNSSGTLSRSKRWCAIRASDAIASHYHRTSQRRRQRSSSPRSVSSPLDRRNCICRSEVQRQHARQAYWNCNHWHHMQ